MIVIVVSMKRIDHLFKSDVLTTHWQVCSVAVQSDPIAGTESSE